MAKVTYGDVPTIVFNNLMVGDYFIHNGKLYLKLNYNKCFSAFDFENDNTVTFSENTPVIFKNGNDIEIKVIK